MSQTFCQRKYEGRSLTVHANVLRYLCLYPYSPTHSKRNSKSESRRILHRNYSSATGHYLLYVSKLYPMYTLVNIYSRLMTVSVIFTANLIWALMIILSPVSIIPSYTFLSLMFVIRHPDITKVGLKYSAAL